MTQETTARKDTQRLQRAIVDGLEDVKAQDIQVFDTEHLSALFERVIVASGTSNRQTKALAASVRDAVREAGFPKPRTEGEQNGEWIIVDCGAAVAHIMQPAIRSYYHLEEIWGDKPIRLKFGVARPATAAPAPVPDAPAGKKGVAVKTSIQRSSAARTAVKAAEKILKAEKAERAERAPRAGARGGARLPARAAATAPAKKAPAKKASVRAPVKVVVKTASAKAPARKTAAAKAPAGRAPTRKAPAGKTIRAAASREAPVRKAPTRKAPARKA